MPLSAVSSLFKHVLCSKENSKHFIPAVLFNLSNDPLKGLYLKTSAAGRKHDKWRAVLSPHRGCGVEGAGGLVEAGRWHCEALVPDPSLGVTSKVMVPLVVTHGCVLHRGGSGKEWRVCSKDHETGGSHQLGQPPFSVSPRVS